MTRSSPSFSPLPRFSGRRRAKITLTLDSDIEASIIHLTLALRYRTQISSVYETEA